MGIGNEHVFYPHRRSLIFRVITNGSATRFLESSSPILNDVIDIVTESTLKTVIASKMWQKTCLNFAVINVPADGLAPLGVRTSASTLMINTRPVLEDLKKWHFRRCNRYHSPHIYPRSYHHIIKLSLYIIALSTLFISNFLRDISY